MSVPCGLYVCQLKNPCRRSTHSHVSLSRSDAIRFYSRLPRQTKKHRTLSAICLVRISDLFKKLLHRSSLLQHDPVAGLEAFHPQVRRRRLGHLYLEVGNDGVIFLRDQEKSWDEGLLANGRALLVFLRSPERYPGFVPVELAIVRILQDPIVHFQFFRRDPICDG